MRQLDKYGGKRIDIRVVTGRRMRLLANSAEEVWSPCFPAHSLCIVGYTFPAARVSQAQRWVETIKQHLGTQMAILRVQTAFRMHRARRLLKRMIAERQAAVKRVGFLWGIVSLSDWLTPIVCVFMT